MLLKINQFIIISLLLLLLSCKSTNKNLAGQYVEIYHVGITTVMGRKLYVGTKKMAEKIKADQRNDLKSFTGDSIKSTPQNIDLYLKLRYRTFFTDERTLIIMEEYILEHKDFYVKSDELNYNWGAASYNVQINDTEIFSIDYKKRGSFFKGLADFLQQEKCDEKLIETMIQYEK